MATTSRDGTADPGPPPNESGPAGERTILPAGLKLAHHGSLAPKHSPSSELQCRDEQWFRKIFDEGPLGMVVADSGRRLIQVNATFCRMLGYTQEELIGLRIDDVTHPDDLEADLGLAGQLVRGETAHFQMEKRYLRKDGGAVPTALTVSVLRSASGQPEHFLGMIKDITEAKVTETQLRNARDAAEAASHAKDRFLAVLSHELRTPLTPVATAAQLLDADTSLSAEQRELVGMIQRNVDLEARLIDDLLDLTRISRGKLLLHLSTVDVHERIRHVIQMVHGDVAAKQLKLTVETKARHHNTQADAARLQQVLWNLLKNAVKFTPAGGRIMVRTQNEAHNRLAVTVEDTGVGIDADLLPRIFNAFEQGGQDVTRQFGGLGLGLAISKALVDLHGGTLVAQSAGRGRGATFVLRLPVSVVPQARHHRDPAVPAEKTPATGRRLLLVEDHADTARLMARVIRSYGYEVVTADCVASALRAAQAQEFDLLISDIGLPDGSGIDLMQQLHRMCDLKGIALSGFGMEEDVRKSTEAGFVAHLTKPVNLQLLERTIREVLA